MQLLSEYMLSTFSLLFLVKCLTWYHGKKHHHCNVYAFLLDR